jgi:hypothetical protein
MQFSELFKKTHPYNLYKIEPQSDSYLINGDLWDYLYDKHYQKHGVSGQIFIPWTLEMGSWIWVKKNPSQIFKSTGLFNPILPHRYKRMMRRHWGLLEFFIQSTINYKNWAKQ